MKSENIIILAKIDKDCMLIIVGEMTGNTKCE